MAIPLNQNVLDVLTPIIVFLFVFAGLYALLMKVKFFGDKSGFNLVVAFAVSMLFFIMPEAQRVLVIFTPWMVLMVILLLFIFLFFMFLGVKGETVMEFAQDGGFIFWMVLIIVIIFLISLTQVFGPFLMVNQQPGFWNSVKRTIFHPKTLGALFLLAVAAYAARYIGYNE